MWAASQGVSWWGMAWNNKHKVSDPSSQEELINKSGTERDTPGEGGEHRELEKKEDQRTS